MCQSHMSMQTKYVSSKDFSSQLFPEMKYFITFSIFFLDIGILFGSLNAFRFGGYLVLPEIHQTHWTSTLFGGVTLLMLGQIFFFLSHLNEEKHRYHKINLAVLGLWVTGTLSNYFIVWSDNPDQFLIISELAFKSATVIFIANVLYFFRNKKFRNNIKTHRPAFLMLSALVWLLFAMISFDIKNSSLDRIFLTSFVYGFFSLTLFGILSYVLPIIYKKKPKSNFASTLDLILLNLAGVLLVMYDTNSRYLPYFIGILGPLIWGIAGFFFILWLFDLLYKSGINSHLIGELVAFTMFGFFVFDTFMKNAFPSWVRTSHVHFMFLGTLLITIVSIGSKVMITQYKPSKLALDESQIMAKENRLGTYSILTIILLVMGILLAFTIEDWFLAGVFGLILFVAILFVQILYLIKFKD